MQGNKVWEQIQKTEKSRTAARPLQLHLLHVNLTGSHPDGNWVDDGRVLKDTHPHNELKAKTGSLIFSLPQFSVL